MIQTLIFQGTAMKDKGEMKIPLFPCCLMDRLSYSRHGETQKDLLVLIFFVWFSFHHIPHPCYSCDDCDDHYHKKNRIDQNPIVRGPDSISPLGAGSDVSDVLTSTRIGVGVISYQDDMICDVGAGHVKLGNGDNRTCLPFAVRNCSADYR